MKEIEKMKAGLEYCYDDEEVTALKLKAVQNCKIYNSIDDEDLNAQYAFLKEMLGSVGEKVWIGKTFSCDNGKNIHIGNNFTKQGNFIVRSKAKFADYMLYYNKTTPIAQRDRKSVV